MSSAFFICFFSLITFPLFCSPPLQLHGPQLSPDLMQTLKERFKIDVLVETGTWGGETAKNGSLFFQEVYTVELSHDLFQRAADKLISFPNVHTFEGHSPVFLEKILPQIEGRVLLWLDAHWCGDNTASCGKNTPIIEELQAIKTSGLKTAVILIDDIRCFHNLPEEVIGYGGYPQLNVIQELVHAINQDYEFWLLGDMAIAFLKEDLQEVSSLIQACTVSRLFNPLSDDAEEVMKAEGLLLEHCNDLDAQAIDFLQCLVIPSTEFITFHLILWKGLLELGRGNFVSAAHCFEKVLNAGYDHWRVYEYLAKAEQASSPHQKFLIE